VSGHQASSGLKAARRSSIQLFSIPLDVLLSKRLLRPAEKSSNGRWIQGERRCQFSVAEAVTAQEQQFGLAPRDDTEDSADFFALFSGGVKLFRCGRAAGESKQALIMEPACLTAKLVQTHPHRCTIEPTFGVFRGHLWIPGEFEEDFDGEFFGTGVVADNSDNDVSDARVLGAKQGFEVEIGLGRLDVRRKFA
jgi:hypothetical protein